MELELRFTGDVQRLTLGPNDALVVTVDRPINRDQSEAIQAYCRKALGENTKVLVIDSSAQVQVMSEATKAG
jgi:hypothetical protein